MTPETSHQDALAALHSSREHAVELASEIGGLRVDIATLKRRNAYQADELKQNRARWARACDQATTDRDTIEQLRDELVNRRTEIDNLTGDVEQQAIKLSRQQSDLSVAIDIMVPVYLRSRCVGVYYEGRFYYPHPAPEAS